MYNQEEGALGGVQGRRCPLGPHSCPQTLWPGMTQNPPHELFLRCLLVGLGLRALELFLSNI